MYACAVLVSPEFKAAMSWKALKAAAKRLYGYYVVRPWQAYNVERRTEKLLDSGAKRVAPRHEGTDDKFRSLVDENPKIKEEIAAKREDLLERLKEIRITSEDESKLVRDTSKFPKDRRPHENPMYGVREPETIPKGKLSMSQAMEVIFYSRDKPFEYTIEMVSKKYCLDEQTVKTLLKYFKAFKVYNAKKDAKIETTFVHKILPFLKPMEKHYTQVRKIEEEKLRKPGEN